MKKRLISLIALIAISVPLFAADPVFSGAIVDESGLAYSKDVDLNLAAAKIDILSVQAVYSSATIAAVSFIDGTKSTGTITVSSFSALGGKSFSIGNYRLIEGRHWTKASTSTGTAKVICDAINGFYPLKNYVTAAWADNTSVVTLTAKYVGTAYNYAIASTSPTALGVSGMTTGTNAAIDYAANTITAKNHALPLALPVLYTVTSGNSPTNLTANATYYAIPVNPYTFKIATTGANAVAGTAIDINEHASAGASSLKVTPIPLSGSATFYFMVSNDGVNFVQPAAASSGTVTTATTANTTFLYDFGDINWKYVRVRFLKPLWGAVRLAITGNGKSK